MSSRSLAIPSLDRLPSGRHHLTPAAVQESQHGRMLFAIAQVVAEKGYAATTVADVVDRASVSRTTFYQRFADKEACFLEAFQFAVEMVLGQMLDAAAALGSDTDWRAHVRSDLETYLAVLAAQPAFAFALHVEVLAAGRPILEHRARMFSLFARRTARVHELARRQEPSLPELPPEAFVLHSGGVDELIREHLRAHGAETLPSLAEPVLTATYMLFGDRPLTG